MFSGSSVFQSEEIKQWFFYAVKRRTFAALGYVSMLILGCPGSGVAGMLCFLLAFCVLRRYIGGYHASTMLRCLCFSLLQTLICVYVLFPIFAQNAAVSTLLLQAFSVASVFSLAPLSPPQMKRDAVQEAECKRRSRRNVMVQALVIFALGMAGCMDEMLWGTLGTVCAAVSLWIEYFCRREEKRNEQNQAKAAGKGS
ncbi:MAG TPA: accessory gene regulator B family protein [Candidatus Ruthenibacterium merdavium]|uniref:Accessory gene regulator B family protein n=1 Tax=Candidatus Ruthenibacterium merdavium TaxID=2838752 RepID=A0A9D2TJN2_9FIRM|nr:accessory gene regulator B family protein [Candidatus Ruthenibacterium merdavium]